MRRQLVIGLVLASLSGCSPYSFPKEVASISDGVDKLSESFAQGYAGLSADRAAKNRVDILEAHARKRGKVEVGVAPSCDDLEENDANRKQPCGLFLKGTPPPQLSGAEMTRAQTMKAVLVLKDYAKALAAVTNAKDREAYDAAVAQLSGAVGAMATPLDAAAPGASTLAPAFVNIFGWLVGTALDQQRYASLKRAVTIVGTPVATKEDPDPESHIRVVTSRLGKGLELLRAARLRALGGEVDVLVDGLNTRTWSEDAYQKRFDEAQALLVVVNALRKADPAGAANDLADAHDKLVLAVSDSTKNYTSLLIAVGEFTEKVGALHAALTAMSKQPSTARKGS